MNQKKYRGVNLGGWLVLEPWISPSIFAGTTCLDEYSLCRRLGPAASDKINTFRDSFIAEADFEWISAQGLNAVRLPIGYWALGSKPPFIKAEKHLDKAVAWAEKYSLGILFSLHGAPGSQNGQNHSGRAGQVTWHKHQDNLESSQETLEMILRRYKNSPAVAGIEVLNEPHWRIPRRTLKKYYDNTYQIARSYGENVAVVINDHYKPGFWKQFSPAAGYSNLLVDKHIYQAYRRDSRRTLDSVINKTQLWEKQISKIQKHCPVIIGEWSLALHQSSQALNLADRDRVFSDYAAAQLKAFSAAAGWFYWTYKIEAGGPWSFRAVIENKWLTAAQIKQN